MGLSYNNYEFASDWRFGLVEHRRISFFIKENIRIQGYNGK